MAPTLMRASVAPSQSRHVTSRPPSVAWSAAGVSPRRGARALRASAPRRARAVDAAKTTEAAPPSSSSSSSSSSSPPLALLIRDESGSGPAFRLRPGRAPSQDDGADQRQPAAAATASSPAPTQTPAAPPPLLALAKRQLAMLFLPDGYPASVSPDYLPYQLWTIPVHVTGWCGNALVTSSLLRAVGATPAGGAAAAGGVVALSAAIRWLTKDGIGALGRLLVGSRLGREFDDDPRRWRMAAEALTSVGLALEVATALAPSQFLLLAGAGTFARAVGKGMGNPVFRVVQTHFAAEGDNVGAVAAKEEVWEVSAQMAGFACSVALLQALQGVVREAETAGGIGVGAGGSAAVATGSEGAAIVCAVWLALQSAHVALRYNALRRLRFRELSHKRAAMLAREHVAAVVAAAQGAGQGGAGSGAAAAPPLPGVDALSEREPMLLPAETAVRPRVAFGRPPAEVLLQADWVGGGGGGGGEAGRGDDGYAAEWARLYEREDYLLAWRCGGGVPAVGEARVAIKAANQDDGSESEADAAAAKRQRAAAAAARALDFSGDEARGAAGSAPGGQEEDEEEATAGDVSRARRRREGRALVRAIYQAAWLDLHCSGKSGGGSGAVGGAGGGAGGGRAPIPLLRESLEATRAHFPAFLRAAREAGWDVDTVTIKGGPRWVVRAEEEQGGAAR